MGTGRHYGVPTTCGRSHRSRRSGNSFTFMREVDGVKFWAEHEEQCARVIEEDDTNTNKERGCRVVGDHGQHGYPEDADLEVRHECHVDPPAFLEIGGNVLGLV